TDSSGHESFRNTTGDSADTGSLLRGHGFEGIDNADDGTEQTDERCSGTDGGQCTDAAFEFGVHNGFRAFQCATGCIDFFTGNFGAALMCLEFLQTSHDNLGQVALLVTV